MFASPPGLIVLFTQRVIGEFAVCIYTCASVFVCAEYISTAENYLAGGWRSSAA